MTWAVQRFLLEPLHSNRRIAIDILVQRMWAQDGSYGAGYVEKYIRPHGAGYLCYSAFVMRCAYVCKRCHAL
jgi:hypothetical protein